jgi:hypothetical protein
VQVVDGEGGLVATTCRRAGQTGCGRNRVTLWLPTNRNVTQVGADPAEPGEAGPGRHVIAAATA